MKLSTIVIAAMLATMTPAMTDDFKDARQEATFCSKLAGAKYSKSSPNESVDRLAGAAVAKCDCLRRLPPKEPIWAAVKKMKPPMPTVTDAQMRASFNSALFAGRAR
jgi:hypothetical protein